MRQPITFRGGRRQHDDNRPHIKLADVLDSKLPAPPAFADWLSDVPPYGWGMLGNDQLGDCTVAGVGHKRIGDVWSNQGTLLEVTTAEVVSFYENFGYKPGQPSTDQGAVCQQVLETWQKLGFLGEKPLAFAKVNLKSKVEVERAICLFGQLYCGFEVPQSAMQQFNAGDPWTVVQGSPIEGGHCVTVGGYDAEGLKAVTWGAVQRMSWEFFRKYFSEAWVIVSADDFDPKTGKNKLGLDSAALAAAYRAVTGRRLGAGTES